jgi:hypothetical protein
VFFDKNTLWSFRNLKNKIIHDGKGGVVERSTVCSMRE